MRCIPSVVHSTLAWFLVGEKSYSHPCSSCGGMCLREISLKWFYDYPISPKHMKHVITTTWLANPN